MREVTRRIFFKQAGALAAAAAVTGTVSGAAGDLAGAATSPTLSSERDLAPRENLGADDVLVAHVTNSRTGEMRLYLGHRELTFRDRKIAARLVRATR